MNLFVCLSLHYVIVTLNNAAVLDGWCEATGAPKENIIRSCTNETRVSNTSLFIEPKIENENGVVERVTCNCVMQHNSSETLTLNVSVTVSEKGATFKFRNNSFISNGSKLNYELNDKDERISTEVLNTQTTCANLTLNHYFSITCSDNFTTDASETGSSNVQGHTTTNLNENTSSSIITTTEADSAGNGFDFIKSEEDSSGPVSSGSVGAIVACCVFTLLVVFGGVYFYRRKNNPDVKFTLSSLQARFSTQNNEADGNSRSSVGLKFLYKKANKRHERMVEDNETSDDNCEIVMEEQSRRVEYDSITLSVQDRNKADLVIHKSNNGDEEEYDHLNSVTSKGAEQADKNVYGMASGNPGFEADREGEYDQLGSVHKSVPCVTSVYGTASRTRIIPGSPGDE